MEIKMQEIEKITAEKLRKLKYNEEHDIYSKKHVNILVDEDVISGEECGFMMGYLGAV